MQQIYMENIAYVNMQNKWTQMINKLKYKIRKTGQGN